MRLGGEEWGRARLVEKVEEGKGSGFMRYSFTLDDQADTLGLALGQQVTLCCLDDGKNVVKGDFFPPRLNEKGGFDVVAMRCRGGRNDNFQEIEVSPYMLF